MTLRQRQPRVEDAAYLAYVRTLPCLVCGRPGPSDPAHIRAAAPTYGKRYTGKGEKPDDKWTLPLCRREHDDQHRHNELAWWSSKGIDPFATAVALYTAWPGSSRPRPERRKIIKTSKRLPKADRKPVSPSRPMQSRPFEQGHRPLRPTLSRRSTP
jgi:hypothetical protein